MTIAFTRNGDITLAYETFGPPTGRPLLLIQGAGAPMIGWPEDFCATLAGHGFQVTRFDNRDAGRSSRARRGYTLADMAADTLAVLDALHHPAAHLVGVSMGGMIAQVTAARHPDRVLSLTSLSSGPDHRFRWDARKVVTLARFFALTSRKPAGPDEAGERLIRLFRILGSPGHPTTRTGSATWAAGPTNTAPTSPPPGARPPRSGRRETGGPSSRPSPPRPW